MPALGALPLTWHGGLHDHAAGLGVPVNITALAGQDALLSIVQMPAGIPVATVAIDNATNAALLAARMLAIGDGALAARLEAHQAAMVDTVEGKIAAVEARSAELQNGL